MTLSGIIIFIVFAVILYYIGMIAWDSYQISQSNNKSTEIKEDEIDISSIIMPEESKPIVMDISPETPKQKIDNKPKFPFPWTSQQIKEVFEKIDLGEECEELQKVVYYKSTEYKRAI